MRITYQASERTSTLQRNELELQESANDAAKCGNSMENSEKKK
jgi:hypothetical protein